MIPKYLKIKGLYSYQKEQEIRFDALTDASLFGIFGAVGSGKSSILEAITFALYGDTERLNRSGDDRTYNMMNLRSDELLIDFECIAGPNGDHYRFTVRGKRNTRNFKDVKTFERKGYLKSGDIWVPLDENTTAESIIGLSYDNFRRTIIIPQGRFQEFIELKDAERTRMMKELFQLEKYDLSRNVATLARSNDMTLSGVEGQLLGLGEVNAEMIAAEEQKRELLRKQIAEVQVRLTGILEQEAIFQKQKADFEKRQQLETELGRLQAMLPEISTREQSLNRFEICSIHFKSLSDQKRQLVTGIQRDRPVFEKNAGRIAELLQLITRQKESLAGIQVHYNVREDLLIRARELERLLAIREQMQQADKYRDQVQKGEEKLREKEALIESLRKEKIELEAVNDSKKAKQGDVSELGLVKSWFTSLDEILKQKNVIRKEAETLQAEISADLLAVGVRIEKANADFSWELAKTSDLSLVQKAIERFFENSEKEMSRRQADDLLISTKLELQRFADNLKAGEPCLLCGSVHHPEVLHGDGTLVKQLAENKRDAEQLAAQALMVRQFQTDVEKRFAKVETLEKQKGNIKARYKQVNERLEEHQNTFSWPRFNRDDRAGFELIFDEASTVQKNIRENEQRIRKLSEQMEAQLTEKAEKIEQPLLRLRNEVLKVESTIATWLDQLEKVKPEDFADKENDVLSAIAAGLKVEHDQLVGSFERATKGLELQERELNTLSGSQATLTVALETAQNELQKVQGDIDHQLLVNGFDSEKEVNDILRSSVDIIAERKALEAFRIALHNTQRDLDLLKIQGLEIPYDPGKHKALIEEKESLTQDLNAQRKMEGGLEQLLAKLRLDLNQKELLNKERERLQLRKTHLDDLARLFRSSGFVDYASSIYLRNLIQAANQRFHQMTRQRLHLELGDGNSFWVRDLLNGGHMRLLKTLSGGQKFQAALSLALALADHIHHRNQSIHNFFFLDEGFGSLDKNALQVVFETLKSLRKENRIVGIISHVEELQQEIQTYLQIVETEEGSKVLASWEA